MSSSDFIIVGLPLLRLDGGYYADMRKENLATLEPSQKWRSAGLSPLDLTVTLSEGDTVFGSGRSKIIEEAQVSGAGLVNHNGRYDGVNGSAVARLVSSSSAPQLEEQTPDSVVASSGLTGAVTAIDDDPYDSASNSDHIELADGGYVLLSFTTPSQNLMQSTDLYGADVDNQVFSIRFSHGLIRVQLYENGSPLGSYQDFESTTINVAEFRWKPQLLASLSGANVEVRIESPVGEGIARVYAINWSAEHDGGGITYTADSGWVELSSKARFSSLDTNPSNVTDILFADPDVAFQPATSVTLRVLNGSNEDGYFEAGTLPIGQAYRTSVNVSYGEILRFWDPSFKGFTYGGQSYGSRRPTLWKPRLKLDWLIHSEGAYLIQEMKKRGVHVPVLVSVMPQDADLARPTTVWATLDAAEMTLQATFFGNLATEIPFVEKK